MFSDLSQKDSEKVSHTQVALDLNPPTLNLSGIENKNSN